MILPQKVALASHQKNGCVRRRTPSNHPLVSDIALNLLVLIGT
ncbi:hypothetical protein GAMM_50008 [Gammaproteobacteria bacterium]